MTEIQRQEKITVSGIVQGVGFRPFVYSLAHKLGILGHVANNSEGVIIEAFATEITLDIFIQKLVDNAPPLSRIHDIQRHNIATVATDSVPNSFEIHESKHTGKAQTLISPDISICDDCLKEMFDPADRRFRHPFINCTNCGPRFTIIRDIPYDRPATTMADFVMCPDCETEYTDPADRRFHAQPIACPACGPRLKFIDATGNEISGDPLTNTVDLLENGGIVAIKGIGGFHLTVDATNDMAVKTLRQRKRRSEKPFALMTSSLESARAIVQISNDDCELLTSRERPIVLLDKRKDAHIVIPRSVAPGQDRLGVMLPYTPLHYLLFHPPETDQPGESVPAFSALVMTSANISEEPICSSNEEIVSRMNGIADAFLMHDRAIHVPCDDSVAARIAGRLSIARRSRGYAPLPVFLITEAPSVLAVGGELKNTLCLTSDGKAWPSQHIGDLENIPTLGFFEDAARHFKSILDIEPETIAYDLHPEYISTKYAAKLIAASNGGLKGIGIQHHHAHIASVMAEHKINEPVVGLAMDGSGYGLDGSIWGGEILVASPRSCARYAKLRQVPLPGGEAAIRNPWRTAFSYILDSFGADWRKLPLPCMEKPSSESLDVLEQALNAGINSPMAGTLGRLFDAVASIIGLMQSVTYEGQAAIALEAVARGAKTERCYPLEISQGSPETFPDYPALNAKNTTMTHDLPLFTATHTVDTRPLINAVVLDTLYGDDSAVIAASFHNTVIAALAGLAEKACRETGISTVALSGGCFQNRILTEGIVDFLSKRGYTVLTSCQLPANDGGLSLGQAYIAASITEAGEI